MFAFISKWCILHTAQFTSTIMTVLELLPTLWPPLSYYTFACIVTLPFCVTSLFLYPLKTSETSSLSAIWQKGESQNRGSKKTKHAKYVGVSGGKKSSFSKNLACFVSLLTSVLRFAPLPYHRQVFWSF